MSHVIHEDDHVIIVRYNGPNGCPGYQVTLKHGYFEVKWEERDYIQMVIRGAFHME